MKVNNIKTKENKKSELKEKKRESPTRLINGELQNGEKNFDNSLRPRILDEYIGQCNMKENLRIFIQAAKMRGETLDHVLLNGPPGLGKTTLAFCIANEMGVGIKATSGPAIERQIDLLVLLKNLKEGDILFIDEIHRLSKVVEEILYPAMEDFVFDRILGKGTRAKARRVPLPRFTLIGATTRGGLISSPLRGRFGINFNLNFYDETDLSHIAKRSAGILSCEMEDEGAMEIARRARGTPRIANRLLRRVRDFAQVKGDGTINKEIGCLALERMGIDENGLDEIDRRILECLVIRFMGNPVGIETLSAYVQEESQNIEEIYEPYLLSRGFISKTPRGRIAAPEAFKYFGKELPDKPSRSTFWD
ncbi:MAG: Holliday junction branch migration DNA helicase RuvB [Candidatus Eremiobacteraeota bacterium]|nr:Holliday junction branch migration DNA helicase RuvB [Candidatus Eremiobacteraeota bacterium]